MRYINRTILYISILLAGLTSCAKEPVTSGGDAPEGMPVTITVGTPSRAGEVLSAGDMPDYDLSTLRVMGYNTSKGTLAFNRLITSFTTQSNTGTKDITRTAQVEILTGDFTIVFIGNESDDLSLILNDDEKVYSIPDLDNLYFSHEAFAKYHEIPMIARYEQVRVLGNNDIEVANNPVNGTWNVSLDRLAVRLNLTLILNESQAENAGIDPNDNSQVQVKLHNLSDHVFLWDKTDNSANTHSSAYNAYSSEGSYGVYEYDEENERYVVKFPRIIIPEKYFNDASNPDKAVLLEITLEEGGSEVSYTARIGSHITGDASQKDYTLPRNNYITISATVKDTQEVEFNLVAQPWEDALNSQVDINGPYILFVEQTDLVVTAKNKDVSLKIESNHPDGFTAVLSDSNDPQAAPVSPSWITAGWNQNETLPAETGKLDFQLDENPEEKRTAYLHIQSGRILTTVRITQDADYFLIIEDKEMEFGYPEGDFSINVETNYHEGFTAVISNSPWLDNGQADIPDWIEPLWEADAIFAKGDHDLKYRYDRNYSHHREAYLHVVAGTLSKSKKITQERLPVTNAQPAANCYMVTPDGSEIFIPVWSQVSRAMNAIGSAQVPSSWLDISNPGNRFRTAVFLSDKSIAGGGNGVVQNVELIGDNTRNISSDNELYLKVTPGNSGGNAIVILYEDIDGDGVYKAKRDSPDVIKWSWHIWNTTYQPDTTGIPLPTGPGSSGGSKQYSTQGGSIYAYHNGYDHPNSANLFMDRDLGDNLFFQWGRKDPIGNAGAYTTVYWKVNPETYSHTGSDFVSGVTVRINLLNSIMNPQVFYTSWDWYSNDGIRNDNLWQNAAPSNRNQTKTVYDPCPPGWRVPISGKESENDYSPWSRKGTTDNKQGNGRDYSSLSNWNYYGVSFDDKDTYKLGYYSFEGYIDHTNGKNTTHLVRVSGQGYRWMGYYSSNAAACFAYLLVPVPAGGLGIVDIPTHYSVHSFGRGNGAAVRCVAE